MAELRVPELNLCVLSGRLTRDFETRYTTTGKAIASSAIAVDRYLGRDERGEPKNDVAFFDIVAWEKTAEMLAERFHKGAPLVIEGRLSQERWEDKQTGQKRSRVVVVVNRVQALAWADKNGQQAQPTNGGQKRQAATVPAAEPVHDDDIPF